MQEKRMVYLSVHGGHFQYGDKVTYIPDSLCYDKNTKNKNIPER